MTGKYSVRQRLLLGTRILLIVAGALWCFAPPRPPAMAQERAPGMDVLTERIFQENGHINSVDKRLDEFVTQDSTYRASVAATLALLQSQIAGMQGEERVIGFVIGLISTVSVVIQVRKKSEK